MIYPERIYPESLFKDGVELFYKGQGSSPYLGNYYTYYRDREGNDFTVVFFSDYKIITPGISYEKDKIIVYPKS